MAKKVVATLKKENAEKFAKVIKAIRSESGSYTFKEEIVKLEKVQEIINAK
ncbi:MAG: DUF4295 family protein [Opitutaceae bacterium]|nr:DUF4295 family protein [Cytophagales bacterium]